MNNDGPVIRTFSGKTVKLFEFSENDVCIEDIARSLSNTCRFRGHVEHPINDAMHSLLVRKLVRQQFLDLGYSPMDREPWQVLHAAALHDASEVYLWDAVTSYKPWTFIDWPGEGLISFKEVERKVLRVIYRKYGIEWCLDHRSIKEADKQACSWEMENCCRDRKKPRSYPAFPENVQWKNITDPLVSETLFLRVFQMDRVQISSATVAASADDAPQPSRAQLQPLMPNFSHAVSVEDAILGLV